MLERKGLEDIIINKQEIDVDELAMVLEEDK